jgi:hypothetical protein
MSPQTSLTIRLADADDRVALSTLAQLDSADAPAAPVLLAESGDRLVAALSLADGRAVADPFRRTADVLHLLRVRAGGATVNGESRHRLRFGAVGRRALPV